MFPDSIRVPSTHVGIAYILGTSYMILSITTKTVVAMYTTSLNEIVSPRKCMHTATGVPALRSGRQHNRFPNAYLVLPVVVCCAGGLPSEHQRLAVLVFNSDVVRRSNLVPSSTTRRLLRVISARGTDWKLDVAVARPRRVSHAD